MTTKEIQFNGKRVKIEIADQAGVSVFEEIFQDNDYFPVKQLIENSSSGTILDLGGHIGCFSIWAATLNPQLRIISIEPEEENFNYLKRNIKNNRIDGVTCKNLAVSTETGTGKLKVAEDSHNHRLDGQGEKTVSLVSFKDLIEKQTNKSGDLLLVKIDIEGTEHQLFAETENEVLKKVKNYIIEYHQYQNGDDPGKIINKLKNLGYHVTKIPSKYDNRMGLIVAKSI